MTAMMTSAGCEVITFRPLSPLVLLSPFGLGRENNRSHRRILVVDGRIGFTGGVGVSPKWLGNGRSKGLWRQTDVRIEGPVVASLQGAFVENWLEATGNVLGGETYFPHPGARGSVTAQVVHSSPAEGSFSMYTMFLLAMSSARHSIYITNPYFLPDSRMSDVLGFAIRQSGPVPRVAVAGGVLEIDVLAPTLCLATDKAQHAPAVEPLLINVRP